jgi:EmrB/QacA subfamily drug resistance transporter
MESLDTTILNTAVPAISVALKVAPLSMKSVLASYTLSLAVFIPISGWMADRFGTRRVFSSAIGLFTLGSLLCGISANIRLLVCCRILQGAGGAMMVPVGRLTMVRTFAKSELVRTMSFVSIPALVAPMLGPVAGGLIVGYLHWRFIFFVNIPVGLMGLLLVYLYLPEYREEANVPLDLWGLFLFGTGIALLSYVLEIFGEHSMNGLPLCGVFLLSLVLLGMYTIHAKRIQFPLLTLGLLRIRTFRAAVGGGFLTRIGIGGVSFLLPLLYQVGLGFTPIQSGLMIMPQAVGAMSIKTIIPRLLTTFGYRNILISNTMVMGVLVLLFATIGTQTPIWVILIQAFLFGAFSSLQYTSMNTLVYSDITGQWASKASSFASAMQQMSISFGVASAGLTAALFIPGSRSNSIEVVHGVHKALALLGGFTVFSTIVFSELRTSDGGEVSQKR